MSSATDTRRVSARFANRSRVVAAGDGARVTVAADSLRAEVGLRGRVTKPGVFRDAIAAAAAVLGSDLRYKAKDRTAYLAYLAKQGKKANAQMWEAQKAFLDESLAQDERRAAVLEPLLTVHPDEASLEVFSQDESSYGRLALHSGLFDAREAAHGSTFVELGADFLDAVDRVRTYLPVTLDASPRRAPDVTLPEEPRDAVVPWRWIRGFLQVQSAATLPAAVCEIAPVDLYNVLYALRTRRAKKSPRALRFELVPGAPPRIVLEPWEIVLECHGPAYKGGSPRVVRTFGRQRLMSLLRVLPHARGVRVHLLGAGMPTFWVVDLGDASLTLGLTGWTESGWSSAAAFDALTPPRESAALAEKVRARLLAQGPMTLDALAKAVDATAGDTRAALQLECLRGRCVYDLARGVYRPRDLFPEPVDEAQIRYGSEREARAHRLLGDGESAPSGEVKLTKVHDKVGEGVEIHGEVVDREAHRSFSPSFTLDLEGRAVDAQCGCPTFRRSGMREGPCEHMLALRLAYTRRRAEEERARQTPEGRKLIRAETRTFVRRGNDGREQVYRLSLDGKVVRVRWGARSEEGREQRLWFDSDREAREAYFGRIEALSSEGYIDAEGAVA
ncbi:MAG: SWIM zinc finger family protein [Polyangiales bacterium]